MLVLLITFFGKEIARYRGEVADIAKCDNPVLPEGVVRIKFERDGKPFSRLFPKERIGVVQAAFPSAQIEYTMYSIGALNISRIRYVGPSREELLNQPVDFLSEEELRSLENDTE